MHRHIANYVLIALNLVICTNVGFAAPLDFRLLSLIPTGSQIVSGFENSRRIRELGGSLFLTTHNNILDLDDMQSILGVDPNRSFREVIEVAFAPPGATPREHLLLLNGKFNREAIFRSAKSNGAESIEYLAETVLAIEPFARERAQMVDTRWLAILEDRTAVFGTKWMVQQALNRFEDRAAPDAVLLQRLAIFGTDVHSWSVLASVPAPRTSTSLQLPSPWSVLLEGTELLMIGISVASKVRLDFFVHASDGAAEVDLDHKASQIIRVFGAETPGSDARVPQLRNLRVEENRVRASVVLTENEFVRWRGGEMKRSRELRDLAHLERDE
jgi:hypothetical protein